MIYQQNIIKNYHIIILISIMLLSIVACEGGSNSAILLSDTETSKNYSPDSEKLINSAETSFELYVEPTFNFDSYKRVNFTINALDSFNQPLNNVMLSISIIDAQVTDFDDPLLQNKSLLTKVFTDVNGNVDVTLEMARSVSKLLLELNTLGVENDAIILLDDTGTAVYDFN